MGEGWEEEKPNKGSVSESAPAGEVVPGAEVQFSRVPTGLSLAKAPRRQKRGSRVRVRGLTGTGGCTTTFVKFLCV